MDTLVIVRKIREAETLADQGSHGDAMRLLEPLLAEAALQDAHRALIRRKLELFEKQRARVTRIMTRSASSSSSLSAITSIRRPVNPNETSEMTAIRKPVDPASERPTDVPLDKTPPGVPTEAVPKLAAKPSPIGGSRNDLRRVGNDTDFGQAESTEVQARPEPVERARPEPVERARPEPVRAAITPVPAAHVPKSPDSTVLMPPGRAPMKLGPDDSQELAPLVDDVMRDEHGDDDPRSTSIFAVPPAPVVVDQIVQPRPESSPTLTRVGTPTEDTKTPPPSPRPAVSEHAIPTPVPVPVRDSIVMPHTQNVIPRPAPGPTGLKHEDDSTYLLADEHFAKPSTRTAPKSTPDLRALVDRLPDDDLRRELALEVVRLREELEKSRREPAVGDSPSRRLERAKPESGTFHIPASQANTIVRRAAGSDRIEVHMPSRDEDAADLQVLRRDSVRGKKADGPSMDRVALAQDYIDAAGAPRPSRLKPLATWLLVAAAVVFVAWLVHLGWKSITAAEAVDNALTETAVGPLELGAVVADVPMLQSASRDVHGRYYTLKDRRWVVQYASQDGRDVVVGITLDLSAPESRIALVQFGAKSLRLSEGTGLEQVMRELGEPDPPFSEELFSSQREYSLLYRDTQGRSVLEVRYRTDQRDRAIALRLYDATSAPAFPELPQP